MVYHHVRENYLRKFSYKKFVFVIDIRGKVWKMAIGNELGLTHELFRQLEEMAREKLEETRQVNL